MEGLLIVAGLALVACGYLWWSTHRTRRKLAQALQRLNVAQAKLKAAEEHAEQVRTQTLGWDQPTHDGLRPGIPELPPRVFVLPVPDRVPADPAERQAKAWAALAELRPHAMPEPARTTEVTQPEPEPETPEPSPLYDQIAATVPVAELDAELLVPPYVAPTRPELADAYDVEETPAEDDVPQDEARVTGLHRSDDDGEPPSEPPPGDPVDVPRVDETAPLAAVAVYRHDWSHARQHPVGPLHWGRGLMHAVDEVRARIYFAPRVWVTHVRPAAVGPLARIRSAVADWWAAVGPDRSQTWRGGELHRVMGGGIAADVHAIVRHRRRGGVWTVTA